MLGLASNIRHVSLSLSAINTLRSVDEWRRQVLLLPSRFLDYLSSPNRRNRFAYCMESILTTQTSEERFFDGGVKTQVCINLDRIFALGSRNLRSCPILASSIHSLSRGRAQIEPNTVSRGSAAAARFWPQR